MAHEAPPLAAEARLCRGACTPGVYLVLIHDQRSAAPQARRAQQRELSGSALTCFVRARRINGRPAGEFRSATSNRSWSNKNVAARTNDIAAREKRAFLEPLWPVNSL
jgi:hypothetical protein